MYRARNSALTGALIAVLSIPGITAAPISHWWASAGQNLFNTHSQLGERQISVDNVDLLEL